MIWTEELSASLDQSARVVVFHRIELNRAQQLAQTLADRVNAMVEQNEKALDLKMGGTTSWNDRADGTKGDKRGEQTQERKGRSERTRGGASARGTHYFFVLQRVPVLIGQSGGRGRGDRFAQGLGGLAATRAR